MNTNLMASRDIVRSFSKKVGICYCPYHQGEVVIQIQGFLCNGKSFVVMKDSRMYHVLIDQDVNEADFPAGVDEYEVERIFIEALQ
jgi:hypothetical protein